MKKVILSLFFCTLFAFNTQAQTSDKTRKLPAVDVKKSERPNH